MGAKERKTPAGGHSGNAACQSASQSARVFGLVWGRGRGKGGEGGVRD
jgi:hypothetical protein